MCCVTHAIHAQLVFKMDADSMINAIVHFRSRRPGLMTLISDCGTNLIGADSIMCKEMETWRNSLVQWLQERGVEWSFITSSTPHLGGLWERVVALFKKHKLPALHEAMFSTSIPFNTIIIEAEGILNRHPHGDARFGRKP